MSVQLLSTINPDYVVPFQVMTHSLARQRPPESGLRWHVFGAGLSRDAKARIEERHAGSNFDFVWYDSRAQEFSSVPTRGRAIRQMYERLVAVDHLPGDVERFIYLDGDLLFLDDIDALWTAELDGAVLGAVQDLAVPLVSSPMGLEHHAELGFESDSPYFNAGVYVVDVAAWKREQIGRRAFEYLARYAGSINLLDQDALNAVLGGRWKPLGYRWNLIGGLAGRTHYQPRNIDAAQLAQAIDDPGIIHFAGLLKPWLYPRLVSLWADAYSECLDEVSPGYRPAQTLKTRSITFYDRWLRTFLYPLERRAWKAMKGF